MAKGRTMRDPVLVALDELATIVQNLFILEALQAGMNVGDIRSILRIDKRRVTNLSKRMKQESKRGNHQ